jgi:ubiquitin carboxyl-terminal hydrolase 7
VFRDLQCSHSVVSTTHLLRAFGWASQEAFTQQDVQEMMRVLVDRLEEMMKGTAVDGVVKELFAGEHRTCMHAPVCMHAV